MLRKRLLLLLAAGFLMASAAWADDIGYIDCNSHPDDTKVFGKARQSQDVVGSVVCGERFTVLVYGFVFSRVQTRDGKIGFIFSNLISVDHAGKTALQPASERVAVPRLPSPAKPSGSYDGVQTAPASATRAAMPTPQPEPVAAQSAPAPSAPAAPAPAPAAASPASASPAASAPAPSSNVSEITLSTAQPSPATPAKPEPVAAQPAPAPATPVAPEPAAQPASTPSQPAPATPSPAASPEPQPASAEPVAPAVRDASVRSSWERPIPGARQTSLLELYGGYALSRFNGGGGTYSNLNGALGSFGVNLKSWLQITGDSSYNFITVGTTKTVLYGNHFGPRVFLRKASRWGATPFVEGLIGGSRLDTTVSGTGGYKTSVNCISYKAGGGVDIHPSRRFEIRLFDVDFYRTAFGTNAYQNSYSISAGIVIRLFGGPGRAD